MSRSTPRPTPRRCASASVTGANSEGNDPVKQGVNQSAMNSTKFFASAFVFCAAAWAASVPREVTFHRDVEKIVQDHCQECHRAGEIAPFPLMSYKDARP